MSKILTSVDGFAPVILSLIPEVGAVCALVYGRVWNYTQMEDGVCTASVQTIANDLCMSYNTIQGHLKALVEAGYLVDLTPDRRNGSHTYADTGKAGLTATIAARDSQENRKKTAETPAGQESGHQKLVTRTPRSSNFGHQKLVTESPENDAGHQNLGTKTPKNGRSSKFGHQKLGMIKLRRRRSNTHTSETSSSCDPASQKTLVDAGVFPEIAGELLKSRNLDDLLAILSWVQDENREKSPSEIVRLFVYRARRGTSAPSEYYHPPCDVCGQRRGHADGCRRKYEYQF